MKRIPEVTLATSNIPQDVNEGILLRIMDAWRGAQSSDAVVIKLYTFRRDVDLTWGVRETGKGES